MPHRKKIIDTDARFEINPVTREIKNVSTAKKILMQYDHNSERFTFTIPRYIEGHDMLESNRVQVHYTTKSGYQDRVELNDLAELPEDEGKLSCTWLLSQNVTKDIGALKFLLRFACVNNDTGEYDYIWSTGIFSGISVSEGMYNDEGIIEQNPDAFDAAVKKVIKDSIDDTINETVKETVGTAVEEAVGTALETKQNKPVIVVASDMKPHPNGLAGLFTVSLDKTYNEIIALFESGEELYILLNTDSGASRLKFETITESGSLFFGECFGDSYAGAEVYSSGACNVHLEAFYTASTIDNMIGDIEPALDSIIAIQNTLIGGETA